jgi:alpha-L-fucosidase
MWDYKKPNLDGEFRFTQSKDGKISYAIMMTWPDSGKVIIKSLRQGSPHRAVEINEVSLLGSDTTIDWTRTANGLEISLPKKKPCDHAYAFRIQ